MSKNRQFSALVARVVSEIQKRDYRHRQSQPERKKPAARYRLKSGQKSDKPSSQTAKDDDHAPPGVERRTSKALHPAEA
jgi:hypothetical protein